MLLFEQPVDLEKNNEDDTNIKPFAISRHFLLKLLLCGIILIELLLYSKCPKPIDNGPRTIANRSNTYFNGTHDFKTLTILISIDGFHPRLIDAKYTPFLYNLHNLRSPYDMNITTAPYMIPSFPTQTFPNHWSMVTENIPLSTVLFPIYSGIISRVANLDQITSTQEFGATRLTLFGNYCKLNRKANIKWPRICGLEVRLCMRTTGMYLGKECHFILGNSINGKNFKIN